MEDEKKTGGVINHFEAGSNCQVFNGNITGCVFAMPGTAVTQNTGSQAPSLNDKEVDIVEKLKPMFFSDENNAISFLRNIQGMKPTQITDLVNKLVEERKLSDLSCHRGLYTVLHDCGIYDRSESNWNQQIKR